MSGASIDDPRVKPKEGSTEGGGGGRFEGEWNSNGRREAERGLPGPELPRASPASPRGSPLPAFPAPGPPPELGVCGQAWGGRPPDTQGACWGFQRGSPAPTPSAPGGAGPEEPVPSPQPLGCHVTPASLARVQLSSVPRFKLTKCGGFGLIRPDQPLMRAPRPAGPGRAAIRPSPDPGDSRPVADGWAPGPG